MACGALLPGGDPPGQDRWAVADHYALVLDGASSFTPSTADATAYVDVLAEVLGEQLEETASPLPAALGNAIGEVVERLALVPGAAPSSTVLIARERGRSLEVLALGDSTAVIGTVDGEEHRFTDGSLSKIAPRLRAEYRARLKGGAGYDERHRELLGELQRQEERARNTTGGYWIAEANERAAERAVTASFPLASVAYGVLATDGVQRVVDHLGITWASVAELDPSGLADLLVRLHRWEETEDPDGALLPRAKRHDDKSIVVFSPGA